MSDMIGHGAAWLTEQRRAHLSREVMYVVNEVATPLLAAVGKTEFEVVGDQQVLQQFESRDFIIAKADLDEVLVKATPARGHRIHELLGGKLCIYEVMSPMVKDPPWRWADATRTAYRIHTKLVAEQEA